MASSDKKIAANRINGRKSPGPKNTTNTRYNAMVHGLTAKGLTQLDDPEAYDEIRRKLTQEKNPVGIDETECIEIIALDMMRRRRAVRFEAECITQTLNPEKRERDPVGDVITNLEGPVVDRGIPAAIGPASIPTLLNLQRYVSGNTNGAFRGLHELERMQCNRKGEHLPAPAVPGLSARAGTKTPDSIPEEPPPQTIPPAEDSAASSDVNVADSQTGSAHSAPAPWNPQASSKPIWDR